MPKKWNIFNWCTGEREQQKPNSLPRFIEDEEDLDILPDNLYIKVLVAEDNIISANILKRILAHRPNLVIEHTTSGSRALELMTVIPNPYSLLILDLHLPQLSGMDILKGIRRRNIDCPIFVLTADKELGQKCLKKGASAMLTKPVNKNDVLKIVDDLIIPI